MEQENRFQIYGRTSYEQPLTFVTEIVITQPPEPVEGQVEEEALAAAANDEWIELIAIPNDDLLQVIDPKNSSSENGTGEEDE